MNRLKVEKLRQYQLIDALRWEIEPYTGIAGTQALVGAQRGAPAEQDQVLILAEEDEEMEVLVAAIEQNVYRAMKQIFRRVGLRLQRIYPPEVCFYQPLFVEGVEGAQAVFDIGVDYANFVIVRGTQPKQISTLPLGREVLGELLDGVDPGEAEKSLSFLLGQVPGPLPMVLTGAGAVPEEIVNYLDGRCEYGARALTLSRECKLGSADHERQNALFASVAGAAIRELRGRAARLIGITDAVPPVVRVRRSAYLAPLLITLVLIVGLLGHYAYMRDSKERYQARASELQAQVKERKARAEQYDKVRTQRDKHRQEIEMINRQLEFLAGGVDQNLSHAERVLRAFTQLPESLYLESITQKGEIFTVTGLAASPAAAGAAAVALQGHPWVSEADIREMAESGEGRLRFILELKTLPEIKEEGQ
jgi:Tfp pilus assembly protein PilN